MFECPNLEGQCHEIFEPRFKKNQTIPLGP
jgi:hypothetical protein